jgi:hypothetical protein
MKRSDSAALDDPPTGAVTHPSRGRFELIFASAWLAVGLFLMPAIIYLVGSALLGPYRETSGLGRFYADFFADLAEPSVRAWILAVGPLLLVTVIRALFIGVTHKRDAATHNEPSSRPPAETTRIEPRVGPD